MDKHRSLKTKFWTDNFIHELEPLEKLLFIYMITNERTNLLGVYEIHLDIIAFNTNLEVEFIQKTLKKFEQKGKCLYQNGYLIINNFTKNQKWNESMKINAVRDYANLPKSLQSNAIVKNLIEFLTPLPEVVDTLYPPHREIERESKRERESKKETQIEKISQDKIDYSLLAKKIDQIPKYDSDEMMINIIESAGFKITNTFLVTAQRYLTNREILETFRQIQKKEDYEEDFWKKVSKRNDSNWFEFVKNYPKTTDIVRAKKIYTELDTNHQKKVNQSILKYKNSVDDAKYYAKAYNYISDKVYEGYHGV